MEFKISKCLRTSRLIYGFLHRMFGIQKNVRIRASVLRQHSPILLSNAFCCQEQVLNKKISLTFSSILILLISVKILLICLELSKDQVSSFIEELFTITTRQKIFHLKELQRQRSTFFFHSKDLQEPSF